jgi:hypothetical protein
MKTTFCALALSAAAFALSGCGNGAPTDSLLMGNETSYYPGALASPDNTQQHHQEVNLGQHGVTNPSDVEKLTVAVGSIEVEARLHSCSKITYAALGQLLTSRGVDMTSQSNGSAGSIYQTGVSALGVADYPARVPEMILPTTATESKQMDIFVAAASAISTTTPFGLRRRLAARHRRAIHGRRYLVPHWKAGYGGPRHDRQPDPERGS